jgi:hypothetical protein
LVRDVISGQFCMLRGCGFCGVMERQKWDEQVKVGRIGVFGARGHDTGDIPVRLESVESECCFV